MKYIVLWIIYPCRGNKKCSLQLSPCCIRALKHLHMIILSCVVQEFTECVIFKRCWGWFEITEFAWVGWYSNWILSSVFFGPSTTAQFFFLTHVWCLSACWNQGMQAKAVEADDREEEGHSVHQGSPRRWHWELHVRVAVWKLCGPEDYRAVGHRWGNAFIADSCV